MKKIKITVLLCLICHLWGISRFVCARETIRIALTEFPPMISEKLENYGCLTEIVTTALKKAGIGTEYHFIDPAGALGRTRDGVMFDATVGWVWSEEREKQFYYSEPVYEAPLVFFHLKSLTFEWKSYDDLRAFPIGIVAKNYYGPDFHQVHNAGTLDVQVVRNDKLNFDKLLHGRVKLIPYSLHSGYFLIERQYGPGKAKLFTHHPRPLKTSVYHVLFSRANSKNRTLVELFNRGFRQIQEDGTYDRLIEERCLR